MLIDPVIPYRILLDPEINFLSLFRAIDANEKIQGHAKRQYDDLAKEWLADFFMFYLSIHTPITKPLKSINASRVDWVAKETLWGIDIYSLWKDAD